MPYPKEFPHQVLGIERQFSQGELFKAFNHALRKDARQTQKYKRAFMELSGTESRMDYEILLPHSNTELDSELMSALDNIGKDLGLPRSYPDLPLPTPLTWLRHMDSSDSFVQPSIQPPQILLSMEYDTAARTRMPLIFDK